MTATKDRTLMAAGLIAIYAFVIGFTDNCVRVIAAEALVPKTVVTTSQN